MKIWFLLIIYLVLTITVNSYEQVKNEKRIKKQNSKIKQNVFTNNNNNIKKEDLTQTDLLTLCSSKVPSLQRDYACIQLEILNLSVNDIESLKKIANDLLILKQKAINQRCLALIEMNRSTMILKRILEAKEKVMEKDKLWLYYSYQVEKIQYIESEEYSAFEDGYLVSYKKYREVIRTYRQGIIIRRQWLNLRSAVVTYFSWSVQTYYPFYYSNYWLLNSPLNWFTFQQFNSNVYQVFTALEQPNHIREPQLIEPSQDQKEVNEIYQDFKSIQEQDKQDQLQNDENDQLIQNDLQSGKISSHKFQAMFLKQQQEIEETIRKEALDNNQLDISIDTNNNTQNNNSNNFNHLQQDNNNNNHDYSQQNSINVDNCYEVVSSQSDFLPCPSDFLSQNPNYCADYCIKSNNDSIQTLKGIKREFQSLYNQQQQQKEEQEDKIHQQDAPKVNLNDLGNELDSFNLNNNNHNNNNFEQNNQSNNEQQQEYQGELDTSDCYEVVENEYDIEQCTYEIEQTNPDYCVEYCVKDNGTIRRVRGIKKEMQGKYAQEKEKLQQQYTGNQNQMQHYQQQSDNNNMGFDGMVKRLRNFKDQISNKLNKNNNHNNNNRLSLVKSITTNNNKLFEKLAQLMQELSKSTKETNKIRFQRKFHHNHHNQHNHHNL